MRSHGWCLCKKKQLVYKCPEGRPRVDPGRSHTERPREGPSRWPCVPQLQQHHSELSLHATMAFPSPVCPLLFFQGHLSLDLGPIWLVQDEGMARCFSWPHLQRPHFPRRPRSRVLGERGCTWSWELSHGPEGCRGDQPGSPAECLPGTK